MRPDEIVQAMVTEYSEGTPIGSHRDSPQFGIIIGISLRSSCRLRLKPTAEKAKLFLRLTRGRCMCCEDRRAGISSIAFRR
jgi:alkylated DNA repair dioxygenase AlkB